MKYQIMLGILFTLLNKRKVTAGELAKKYGCSVRSIYRYIDEMTICGVPIEIAHGARGGLYISDCYKLPRGFMTREEYESTLDALYAFREQLPAEAIQSAIEKFTAQRKVEKFDEALSGNVLVDSGAWGSENRFSDKLSFIEGAIAERAYLDISYIDRGGEASKRRIKPLLLIFKQNIWYLYAFCTLREDFRLFKIGRIRSVNKTGETFEPVAVNRDDLPLNFKRNENTVEALFEIAPEALPFAEEWLGVENIDKDESGRLTARATLPDDESLAGQILSAGAGFKVIYPQSLIDRVKREAQKIVASY